MLYADTITLPPLIDSQKTERARRAEEDAEPSKNGFNSVSSLVRDILHYGSTVSYLLKMNKDIQYVYSVVVYTLNSIRTKSKKFGLVHQRTALRGWCNRVSRQNVIWQIGRGI